MDLAEELEPARKLALAFLQLSKFIDLAFPLVLTTRDEGKPVRTSKSLLSIPIDCGFTAVLGRPIRTNIGNEGDARDEFNSSNCGSVTGWTVRNGETH